MSAILLACAVSVDSRRMEYMNIFGIGDGETTNANTDFDFETSFHPEDVIMTTATVQYGETSGVSSCAEASETLIAQEDLRWELQDINVDYLENASIEKACSPSIANQDDLSCDFDFGLFRNNLNEVCGNHGGVYDEREHSIQCHNPKTLQQLYYQFDHFPNCFPASCERSELETMMRRQIDSVRRALEIDSGMTCYADYDILRHANDSVSGASGLRPEISRAVNKLTVLVGFVILGFVM